MKKIVKGQITRFIDDSQKVPEGFKLADAGAEETPKAGSAGKTQETPKKPETGAKTGEQPKKTEKPKKTEETPKAGSAGK